VRQRGTAKITVIMSNDIKNFFDENSFYFARGVFSSGEIRELEADFDRIVAQLNSGEEENRKTGTYLLCLDPHYVRILFGSATVFLLLHHAG